MDVIIEEEVGYVVWTFRYKLLKSLIRSYIRFLKATTNSSGTLEYTTTAATITTITTTLITLTLTIVTNFTTTTVYYFYNNYTSVSQPKTQKIEICSAGCD